MQRIFVTTLLAVVSLIGACQGKDEDAAQDAKQAEQTKLTAAMANAADLSVASRLIGFAQLGPALDGRGSYTVFMPVDRAWSELDGENLKLLESEEGRPELIAVLRQHIASGYLLPGDIEKGLTPKGNAVSLASMGAAPIKLRRDGSSIMLGDGKDAPRIVGDPIKVGNDVIYRIDRLIPPPT